MSTKRAGSRSAGDLTPGLYRMRVARCEARHRGTGIAKIALELESTDWGHAAKRATIEIDWTDHAERAQGAQIFAIAGNPISEDRDAECAAKGMRGREFYVEVTREGRIHVQQLATTHHMTSPMIAGRGRIADDRTRSTKEFANLGWPQAATARRGR